MFVMSDARMGAILDGLRSTNDIRQSEAAAELAEQLLMGNEDSLPQNMPIKELIASLISILQGESNYELVRNEGKSGDQQSESIVKLCIWRGDRLNMVVHYSHEN